MTWKLQKTYWLNGPVWPPITFLSCIMFKSFVFWWTQLFFNIISFISASFISQKTDMALVEDLDDVTRISADNFTSVALDSKGCLFLWGHPAHPVVRWDTEVYYLTIVKSTLKTPFVRELIIKRGRGECIRYDLWSYRFSSTVLRLSAALLQYMYDTSNDPSVFPVSICLCQWWRRISDSNSSDRIFQSCEFPSVVIGWMRSFNLSLFFSQVLGAWIRPEWSLCPSRSWCSPWRWVVDFKHVQKFVRVFHWNWK